MPDSGVRELVQRILTDEDFAAEFKRHPEFATVDYDLTPDEAEAISKLDVDRINEEELERAKSLEISNIKIGLYID